MLARILTVAQIALCLALTGLCAAGGIALWRLGQELTVQTYRLDDTMGKMNATLDSINQAAAGLNATIQIVNRPCGKQACGTLADIAKTLNTVRGTAGEIEIAAH